MKKGTIMTIDQKFAYVFTSDCRMEKILWKPGMTIGKEIEMKTNMQENIITPITRTRTFRIAMAAACLVLLLVVGILAGQGLIFNPVYARLSIDVNPSIELLLNRQMEVHEVRILNEEARQVMGDEDLRGLPWRDAVEKWALLLRERFQENIQTMLFSAVIPDQAAQFVEQLMNMEGTRNAGALSGLQVRVIYTKDGAVAKQAQKNGLSVGRQMLLNQSLQQQKQWNADNIADAPLGEMVRQLLRQGEADQTGTTNRATESASDPSGSQNPTSGETSRETNRETNGSGSTQSSGSQNTNRETNRETSGESQASSSGTGEGSQYTNQETKGETAGSTMGSAQTQQETSGTSGSGGGN